MQFVNLDGNGCSAGKPGMAETKKLLILPGPQRVRLA
jgi:hypothetical protein